MVVGNSSSGLIEVPSFRIPTINIGDRQKGRIRATSVLDVEPDADKIALAMSRVLEVDFQKACQSTVNPYGDGNTSEKVVAAIKDMFSGGIELKKKFYDLEFTEK